MTINNRESKIREIKKHIVDTEGEMEHAYNVRKKVRLYTIIGVIAVAAIAVIVCFLLVRFYKYTSCEMNWEKQLSESKVVGYAQYGENVIKYTHDGAMYYNTTANEEWIDSYEMNNPKISVNGEYACIYDCKGNELKIYNSTGVIGKSSTILPISKAVISQNGICATITEDSDVSYIDFYNKDGESIDIQIKTKLSGDGYPMDISLSPDGTQLMAAFSYLDGGQLKSKVVFYDFSEIGKSIPNRLVGGFDDPFGDSLVAQVRFIDSVYSYAVSDTGICFFSSRNLSSPELIKEIPIEDAIESVFDSESHVGVIKRNPAGSEKNYNLTWYREDGSEEVNYDFSLQYTSVLSDDDFIYLMDEDTLIILNLYGKEKYNGPFKDRAGVVRSVDWFGRFLFSSSGYIREYQFR